MNNILKDDDYVLGEDGAWVEVGGFAVRLFNTGNGLRISVCKSGDESNTIQEIEVFNYQLEA